MATAVQILKNTFGVKTLTPTDPGIIKLAEIRSGVYPQLGPTAVTITPTAEVQQLLGQAPDPLAQAARQGALDTSNTFLDKTLPQLLIGATAAVATGGFGAEFLAPSTATNTTGGLPPWLTSSLRSGTQAQVSSIQRFLASRVYSAQLRLRQQILALLISRSSRRPRY